MKQSLHFAPIAGLLALCAVSAPLPIAGAQPNEEAPVRMIPIITIQDVTAVASEDGLAMNLRLENADVVDALSQIATRGNLELVTRGDIAGTVSLSSKGEPEDVLQAFCKAAHLSPRKVNGVWSVEKAAVPVPDALAEKMLNLRFRRLRCAT